MIRLMNGNSSSYIKNNYAIQYVMIYVISMLSVNFEKTHIIKDGSKRERVDKQPENISIGFLMHIGIRPSLVMNVM